MAIVDLSDLDLNTKDGRKQARQRLGELLNTQHKQNLLDKFLQANNEDLTDDENDGDRIDRMGNLLSEIDFIDKAMERSQPQITAWDEIEVTDREWLIHQWLPANTVTMFTGDGGAGKSWFTLQAVCQIACGFRNAFLDPDYRITPPADYDDDPGTPKHVVFATYEDEPAEIKRRLQALASGMKWIADSMETIRDYVHIVDMRGIGSVWGPGIGNNIANTGDLLAAGEDLREICEEKQARLLVMDPLSGAFGGNENDRSTVYDFVSSFRGWGDKAKCAVFAIGHLPKGTESRAAGFSGSTAWEASARSMWKISVKSFKEDNNERRYWALEHTKSNYAPLQPEIPVFKEEGGWWVKADNKEEAADGLDEYNRTFQIKEENDV